MVSFLGQACLLLAVSMLGGSNGGAIISAGGKLQGPRAVISFAAHQTTEDRRVCLQRAKEQGYTCWMLPNTHESAICIQNPSSMYTDLPESAEALRLTLAKVSLGAWLPSLLCPSPLAEGEAATIGSEKIDHTRCREVVEAALATQPHAEIILTASRKVGDDLAATIRASVDDTPWLQAMQSWIGWGDADYLKNCSVVYIGLASQCAKMQLLPALRILAGQKQTRSSPFPGEEKVPPNTAETVPATASLAEPSAARVESLLALLEGVPGQTNAMMAPSLHMVFPQPGGRISGGVVAFIGEVTLGAALTASLDRTNPTVTQNRGTELFPAEQRQLSDDYGGSSRCAGGRGCYGFGGHTRTMPPPDSDFDNCVVRVIVDDAVASTIPLDAATFVDDNGDSDAKATVTFQTAIVPAYENEKRCSEHPEKKAAAVSPAVRGAWTDSDFTWRVEARAIDTICTRETFGHHRIHGELACRRIVDDETLSRSKGVVAEEEDPAIPSLVATPEPPPRPEVEPNLDDSHWEVLATSEVVEYFHTGNLVDVLSSSPWAAAVEGKKNDNGNNKRWGGSGDLNSLLTSPPEDLSVSLYVESDPENTAVVVTVPRWFSDGEVWEAAFSACSEIFGPSKGFMVNNNDCVDLVTSAVAAKRVDLYYIMSLRLAAYLDSINPDFVFLGNTGSSPEKVEALGAIVRTGGHRVSTICEVGFNAGHSSLNWLLSSRPSTNILAFDLGEYDYMKHAVDFLQAVFPGRVEMIEGDSAVTVPAYATAQETAGRDPRVCDVVFVDGDHTEEGAYADIVNLQVLASRNWNVLTIDDLEDPPVEAAWRRYRADGGGKLEHVVKATGEYFAHCSEGEGGTSHVGRDDNMRTFFLNNGHFSLGVGTYMIP